MANDQHRQLACFSENGFRNFIWNYPDIHKILMQQKEQHGQVMFRRHGYCYLDLDMLKTIPDMQGLDVWFILEKLQVIKAKDCVVAFGIPTDPELARLPLTDFQAHSSDYLQLRKNALNYQISVLQPIWKFINFLRREKIEVREKIGIENLPALFDKYKVILLYTHAIHPESKPIYHTAGQAGLEIGYKFVANRYFIITVPDDFKGTLDFCTCRPITLINELNKARPSCSLHYIRIDAQPEHWLLFYRVLFTLLRLKNLSYQEAVLETSRFINRKTKKGVSYANQQSYPRRLSEKNGSQ